MKKTFRFLVAALALMGVASCADVPELPYPTPDPNGGGGGGTTTGSLPFTSASLNDFEVKTIEGVDWSLGSSYAKASGYANGSTTATKTWLVSPAINTTITGTDGVSIAFDNVLRYVKSSTDLKGWHKVLASKDYAGDVTTATWTDLNFQPVESATQTWDFYAANPVSLPEDLLNEEKVYVAFYFQCDGANSTTWELKNFTIQEGKIDNPGPGPDPNVDATPVTIAEFNAAAVSKEVWYELVGTATGIKSGDQYGNFDLKDETGTVYVYGLLAEKGGAGKAFQDLVDKTGLANGDKIKIHGQRGDYQGKIEVLNAYLVEIVEKGGDTPPSPTDATPATIAEFNAAAVSTEVWYELVGTASNIKAGDIYGNFDLTDETGTVYVYGLLAEKGGAAKAFQDLVAKTGLANGDKIKIHGQRGDYQGKIEVKEAYLVEIVEKGGGETPPGPGPGGDGDGTQSSPYSVAYVRSANNPGTTAWVKGYIVGTVKDGSQTYSDAVFGTENVSNTNILLADAADCTDASLCIPVQLPAGEVRNALSLQQHPENLGKQVWLYANLEKYFGQTGLKSASKYSWEGGNGGDDPDPNQGDDDESIFSVDFTKSDGGFKAYDIELGNLDYVWQQTSNYGWKASAFKDKTNIPAESYILSPVIDLTSVSSATLTFSHTANYLNGAACKDFLSVYISTRTSGDIFAMLYDGAVTDALTVPTWPAGSDWTFVDSGDISLNDYVGKEVVLAFFYHSTDATAPTWEIKSLTVK